MVRGIEDFLQPRGYTALLANTDDNDATERLAISSLLARRVDGLLVVTGTATLHYATFGTNIVDLNNNASDYATAFFSFTPVGHASARFENVGSLVVAASAEAGVNLDLAPVAAADGGGRVRGAAVGAAQSRAAKNRFSGRGRPRFSRSVTHGPPEP